MEPTWETVILEGVATITLEGIRRVHPDGTAALDGIDLHVEDGEFLGVIGPSGAGKSTLLRVIAGLEEPSAGVVRLDGQDVEGMRMKDRNLAMVSQSQNLLSFLDVAGNVALPLEFQKKSAQEVDRRTGQERRSFRLGSIWGKKASALSGGDAQRTALARAMVRAPRALLADEPLQLLDPPSANELRREMHRVQREHHLTMIYTTNDHNQVLGIADRVAVIRRGRLVQVGPPEELLHRPVSSYVAGFVGEPAMTMVTARLGDESGLGRLWFGQQWVRFPGGLPGPLRDRVGQEVLVGARPDRLRGSELVDPVDARLEGTVVTVQRLGPYDLVEVRVSTGVWQATFDSDRRVQPGDQVEVTVDVRGLTVFSRNGASALWHADEPG